MERLQTIIIRGKLINKLFFTFLIISLVFSSLWINVPQMAKAHPVQQGGAPECIVWPLPGITNSSSDRVLVLLQGLGTDANSVFDQDNEWNQFTGTVGHLYGGVVFFSYKEEDPNAYSSNDTSLGVFSHHIGLLQKLLESCHQKYPGFKSFDLVGHSQGGVNVNEYIKSYGLLPNETAAQMVAHILTLDSPINGSQRLYCTNVLKLQGCLYNLPLTGIFQKWGYQTQSGNDLGIMYQSQNIYKQQNSKIAQLLKCRSNLRSGLGGNVGYLNLTNSQDLAVGPKEAIADPNYGKTYNLGTDVLGVGHFLIYSNLSSYPDVITDILTFLQSSPQCLSIR